VDLREGGDESRWVSSSFAAPSCKRVRRGEGLCWWLWLWLRGGGSRAGRGGGSGIAEVLDELLEHRLVSDRGDSKILKPIPRLAKRHQRLPINVLQTQTEKVSI
jgi:hypothetical protein